MKPEGVGIEVRTQAGGVRTSILIRAREPAPSPAACSPSRVAAYGPASERALAGRTPTIGARSGPAHGHAVPAGHQPGFAER